MVRDNLSINDWRNAIFDAEINYSAKLVALAIARYWVADRLCYPSLSTISRDCSLTKPTVINAIKILTDTGFIKVKKGELKYLSSLQNFYELVGVDDGKSDGKTKGKEMVKPKVDQRSNDGKIDLPEIREEENIENKENIYTSQDKSCSVKKLPKISFAEVVDFETLFTYWEQNKKGGKYKTLESRQRQLEKLRKLTNDNLSYAKDAITFSIDAGYQGFTDGQVLYYKGKYDPDEEFWEMVSREAREYEEEQKHERAV